MSDPTLSDIDFKNKMALVQTTLNVIVLLSILNPLLDPVVLNPVVNLDETFGLGDWDHYSWRCRYVFVSGMFQMF